MTQTHDIVVIPAHPQTPADVQLSQHSATYVWIGDLS